MASYLTLLGCDSLIVTGTTTSGCVRATVLDAFSLNYRIALAEEGCFDRSQASHAINLCDMNAKYADVVKTDEVLAFSTRCRAAGRAALRQNSGAARGQARHKFLTTDLWRHRCGARATFKTAGAWNAADAIDCVTLDAHGRHRRRIVLTGERGTTFLLDLPHAIALRDGDGLILDDGAMVKAARTLRPPFVEAARHETLVEELDDAVGPFDVVWATHALYSLAPDAVRTAAARMLAALAPGGALLIAQGSREGHYLRFYRHFLDDVRDGQGTPYAASEDLAEALRACGADPRTVRLSYDHTTALENAVTVEGYLQRCVFDDSVSLEEMMTAPHLGPYLQDCRDEDEGRWRFHQEVDVLLLGPAFAGLIQ